MRIEIELDTDNDAFTVSPYGEPSRLVHEVATLISAGDREGRLRDYNGNAVGTWAVTD